MRIRIFILFLLTVSVLSFAQDITTNGDKYFYGYAYEDAIREYHKQMQKGQLMTNYQLLNLADSYFKTGDYNNAAKMYLDIHRRDTIMSNNRFNNMLQSLSKTSEPERVRAFLRSKSASLSPELMENASFNYELLDSNTGDGGGFFIFNLNINSPQADFSPTFYKDNLLFSSSRSKKSKKIYAPSGESYLDIYLSKLGNDGRALNAILFERIPKSEYHKSTPYYSEELGRIFYVLSNEEDGQLAFDSKGKNALAIGMVYENGFFRYVLKDMSSSFYYPFFEEASGRLYFAANFPDGYGGTDIYYVHTNNLQVMSAPINLGPRINTPGNEIAPFLFDDSLFFSSDIFYGLGGMDIYKTNIQSDGIFSTPVNLGSGINSALDDFGLIIKENDGDGFIGYFSSNRRGGKGNDDIYGFKINSVPGLRTLMFRGQVVNQETDQGIADVLVKLVDAEKNTIKEVVTNEDGDYQLEIPWREDVNLHASKSRHSIFYQEYNKEALEALRGNTLEIALAAVSDIVEEKEDKTVLKLGSFIFTRGKSDLTPLIMAELDKVVAIVKEFPQIKLRIEAHTDSRGSTSSNKRLSQKRADVMMSYLREKGVSSANLATAIGLGEEKILNSCTNGVYCLEFLHEQNVRTLVEVLNFDELDQ